MRLRGKVAIITGAASGIGAGCALAFAREGARAVVADINDVAGNSVVEEIRTKGGEACFVHVDVTKRDDLRRMIQVAVESYGRVDILLNNAGTHIPQETETCTEETWDFLMTLNLKSMWRAVQEALPELKKANGNILNMGSDVGLVGQADAVAYCASKGGVIAMTKAMAVDLAKYPIRVNCLCPAGVETPLITKWADQQQDPQAARQSLADLHRLGRMATPEEIGAAAVFLASDEASFITGTVLQVDGGALCGY